MGSAAGLGYGSASQHDYVGSGDIMNPIVDATLQGMPSDWHNPNPPNNLPFDTSAFQSEQEQVNLDKFLSDLGFGNEGAQTTFDHVFLHPLPDFPVEDWGAGNSW